MKLSNFELLAIRGKSPLDWQYLAMVDVTTGALWWKKTKRRAIHRNFASYWTFIDSGDFTPEFQAEMLYTNYKAKEDFGFEAVKGAEE